MSCSARENETDMKKTTARPSTYPAPVYGARTAFLIALVILQIACGGLGARAQNAQQATLQIKVDQVGYPPEQPKLAMVTAKAKRFKVKRASDNAVVFKAKLGQANPDADTGDSVKIADFSKLRDS